MLDQLRTLFSTENTLPVIILNVGVLFIVALLAYYVFRQILGYAAKRLTRSTTTFISTLADPEVIKKIAKILPWIIIQVGITLIPNLAESFVQIVRNIATAMTLLYGMLTISVYLEAITTYFTHKEDMRLRSIKSYVQLAQLAIFILGAICIIAVLINRSPVILLSGLGAMSAITMLVFKDTILSFVAGVQLSSNDTLRVGDWIEMPQVGADGDVIDIALQVVKVQNWDKTVTSIPTWRFMQESFKNWRGMQESGGRRIKRSLYIDISSVGFVAPTQFDHLCHLRVLKGYLADKQVEIDTYNSNLGEDAQMQANRRRLTNLGTFRAYALAYLKSHPRINQTMTCMVRQLAPQAEGIPMEIYCFTNTTAWAEYEGIQGDIFDHLFSVLSEFGLRAYQQPSGHDMSLLAGTMSPAAHETTATAGQP